MTLLDIFVGVPQSKYAGAAILMSLIAVSLAILIGRDSLPLSQKFAFVLLIFLVSLPGLLLTLFQLTCLVTGDKGGKAWWCGVYSWIVSGLLIIYSILLVSVAVLTLASGGKILDQIAKADVENFEAANKAAAAAFTDKGAVNGQMSLPAPVPQSSAPTPQMPHGTVSLDPLMVDAVPGTGGAASTVSTRSFSDVNNVSAYDSTGDSFANYEGFADAPSTTGTTGTPSTPTTVPTSTTPSKNTPPTSCPVGCIVGPSPM